MLRESFLQVRLLDDTTLEGAKPSHIINIQHLICKPSPPFRECENFS